MAAKYGQHHLCNGRPGIEHLRLLQSVDKGFILRTVLLFIVRNRRHSVCIIVPTALQCLIQKAQISWKVLMKV